MTTALIDDLQTLEDGIQTSGRLTAEAVTSATRALVDWSAEAFESTLKAEDEVKQLYTGTDQLVESILVSHRFNEAQLRTILAALHINRSLERAAHNAARVAHLATPPPRRSLVDEAVIADALRAMGERAAEMVRTAVDTFERRDVNAARLLSALDEMIDRENEKLSDTILSIEVNDPELRRWSSRMLFAGRWLERIGDHAVNAAERTTYMLTGPQPPSA
ncbi:MAG: phosphate uptake regulator PhoU [Thermoleophilia bacterium]